MARAIALTADGKLCWEKGTKRARGRPVPGVMNSNEAAYKAHLELRKQTGEILWYIFEAVTLKLAAGVTLKVDFFILLADYQLIAVDCKGKTTTTRKSGAKVAKAWIEEDARIKLRMAAAMFPFRFFTAFLDRGVWVETEIPTN